MNDQESILAQFYQKPRSFKTRSEYRKLRSRDQSLPSTHAIDKHFGSFRAFKDAIDGIKTETPTSLVQKWRDDVARIRLELFGTPLKPLKPIRVPEPEKTKGMTHKDFMKLWGYGD